MGFEWDPTKDMFNQAKHDLAFEDAVKVFDSGHLIENSTRPEHGEVRWQAIGRIGPDYITVIFTIRGEKRRVISARRASKDERERYRASSVAG